MSTSLTEAPPPSPAATEEWAAALTPSQPSNTARRRGRLLVPVGVLGACLAVGVAGGMTVQGTLHHEEPAEQPATARPAPSDEHAPQAQHGSGGAIDALIRAGCFN